MPAARIRSVGLVILFYSRERTQRTQNEFSSLRSLCSQRQLISFSIFNLPALERGRNEIGWLTGGQGWFHLFLREIGGVMISVGRAILCPPRT